MHISRLLNTAISFAQYWFVVNINDGKYQSRPREAFSFAAHRVASSPSLGTATVMRSPGFLLAGSANCTSLPPPGGVKEIIAPGSLPWGTRILTNACFSSVLAILSLEKTGARALRYAALARSASPSESRLGYLCRSSSSSGTVTSFIEEMARSSEMFMVSGGGNSSWPPNDFLSRSCMSKVSLVKMRMMSSLVTNSSATFPLLLVSSPVKTWIATPAKMQSVMAAALKGVKFFANCASKLTRLM
mmetsp:Transcript_66801/g.114779  ORF Transcript_66801/g.114779 Transcript_66801/m.114779 type:complete len:245 (-) Transcript_66801:1613-2347(-)